MELTSNTAIVTEGQQNAMSFVDTPSYAHAANLQAWIEGQYERSILGLERLPLKDKDCPARCGRYLDISLDDWARVGACAERKASQP